MKQVSLFQWRAKDFASGYLYIDLNKHTPSLINCALKFKTVKIHYFGRDLKGQDNRRKIKVTALMMINKLHALCRSKVLVRMFGQ